MARRNVPAKSLIIGPEWVSPYTRSSVGVCVKCRGLF